MVLDMIWKMCVEQKWSLTLAGHSKNNNQKKHKRFGGNEQKAEKSRASSSPELFDTGVRCCICSIPLCVPGDQVPWVLDSLKRTGCVILVCSCGAIQLARLKLKTND